MRIVSEAIMLNPGDTCQTPFEPSGLVEVIRVEPGAYCGRDTVLIRFLEDHPHGYPAGNTGRYFTDELRPVEPSTA